MFTRQLTSTGIVASIALLALFGSAFITHAACNPATLGPVALGQSGNAVQTLQQCLIDIGYTIPAGPTGYYGEQTRSAVRAFYTDVIKMPEWEGASVGPVGRSALAQRASARNTTVPGTGAYAYRTARDSADLARYVNSERYYGSVGTGASIRTMIDAPTMAADEDSAQSPAPSAERSTAGRVSTTNVQVAGIDEPDIVKTDGEHLFVSNPMYGRWFDGPMPLTVPAVEAVSDSATTRSIMPEMMQRTPTRIIDALPPSELAVISEEIKETGDMLLVRESDVLVVLAYPDIVAYSVEDAGKPKKLWTYELKDNTSLVTARLKGTTMYLVTQTYLQSDRPCPVMPMTHAGVDMIIPCGQILVPDRIEPVDHLFTALAVNTQDGTIARQHTFAAEGAGTTVYMSEDNLYIATQIYSAQYRVLADLMIETMSPYLSAGVIARARTIQGYDISDTGKLQEIDKLFQSELATLSADEKLRIENEAANSYQERIQKRIRDMYRTRITRLPIATLAVAGSGEVPGHLLNQFAMDEYAGNLRVAVTVDDGWGGGESANDVYVLNSSLGTIGSVIDLGISERIYSVRFMGDTGYLVTFRQIDPFYVLDLGTPTAPKVVGELKIPGYSAYLEPLGNDLVLGVGREGSGVKLSIFDVTNPAKPVEKSKYQLKDGWTEVESNHHAFLRDADNELFFIPGGEGGYVFGYEDGALTLQKTFAGYGVKRAVYIDYNFYVVSDDAVRVFDMTEWEEVGSLRF